MKKVLQDELFLFAYVLYIINQVLSESQYINYGVINSLLQFTRYALLGVFIFCIWYREQYTVKQMALIMVMLCCSCINTIFFNGGMSFLAILLITLASKGCSLKRIFSYTAMTLLCTHLFVMISVKLGFVQDDINIRYVGNYMGDFLGGQYVRHSMGFIVHNQVALAFFIIYILYIVIRKDQISLVTNIFIMILNYVVFVYFGSRIVFLLVILTCFLYCCLKYSCKIKEQFKIVFNSNWGLIIYPFFAIVSLLSAYFYNAGSKFFNFLNLFFNNRLTLAHEALNYYGITLFGLGQDAGTYNMLADNTVDNGYILIFIQLGMVLALIVIGVWSYLIKLSIKKNKYLFLALFILAVENLINTHLYSYKMLPFFCILMNTSDVFLLSETTREENSYKIKNNK